MKFSIVFISFAFAFQVRLFEFCQTKLGTVESRINLTEKISLKFHFTSSLLKNMADFDIVATLY